MPPDAPPRRRSTDRDPFPAILEAGIACFSRAGFRLTQMADIARGARVSVGTLYLYVAGKEALFHACLAAAGGDLPARGPAPWPFEGWGPVRDLLARQSAALARWPVLEAALAAAGPPDRLAAEAVAAELYDLIDRNRRLLKLVDMCVMDIPELSDLFEIDIKRRVLEDVAAFAQRVRPRPAGDAAADARAVIELLTWMAMHRHTDDRPIAADEATVRARAVRAAAAALA